jgi:hypothetical protein
MWKIAIRDDPLNLSLGIFAVRLGTTHSDVVSGELLLHTYPNDELYKNETPMLSIPVMMDAEGFMKALVQALVEKGYTKWEDKDVKGELKSVKDHLNDMRAIVQKQLDVSFGGKI